MGRVGKLRGYRVAEMLDWRAGRPLLLTGLPKAFRVWITATCRVGVEKRG